MRFKKCVPTAGLLALAIGVLAASSALAATNLSQRPGDDGCISGNGFGEQCRLGLGLGNPTAVELSPDGADAYATSAFWDGIVHLDRDPVSGTLDPINTKASCIFSNDVVNNDCTDTDLPLGNADDLAISGDGGSVYVAAPEDDALVIVGRDTGTGALSLDTSADGCVSTAGAPCTAGRAMEEATSVAVSPDDAHVYVASAGTNGGIAVFDRAAGTGVLTQKADQSGCISPNGADGTCTAAPNQLLDVREIDISPDGKNIYAVSRNRDSLLVFDRDPSDGTLEQKTGVAGCFVHRPPDLNPTPPNDCQFAAAMLEPASVTVSPDGENVYVASGRSDAVLTFDRDPANGELTQKPGTAGCVSNLGTTDPQHLETKGSCADGTAMDEITSIAVLPDGSALYAAARSSDGVVVFERNGDGSLDQRPGTAGCITETTHDDTSLPWTEGSCEDGLALLKANSMIASDDSKYVYATAGEGGVATFDVVDPPSPPPPPEDDASEPEPEPTVVPAACVQARKDFRVAKRRVRFIRRGIRFHARRAKRARRPVAKRKHRVAVRRSRLRIRRWRRVARRSVRIAGVQCPSPS